MRGDKPIKKEVKKMRKETRINWSKIDVITYNPADMSVDAYNEYRHALDVYDFVSVLYSLTLDYRYKRRMNFIQRRIAERRNFVIC